MAQKTKRSRFDDAYDFDFDEAVWVELPGGAEFLVRSDNHPEVEEWAKRRTAKQRALIISSGGSLPTKIQRQNEIDQLAEVSVRGWRGEAFEGQEFDAEALREILADKPALREDLLYATRVRETFRVQRAEEEKAIKGNSSTPSKRDST